VSIKDILAVAIRLEDDEPTLRAAALLARSFEAHATALILAVHAASTYAQEVAPLSRVLEDLAAGARGVAALDRSKIEAWLDESSHKFAIRDLLIEHALLRREVLWVDGDALIVLRDTFDKLLRAVDLVDELRELVGNAVDAHLAVMSNQMNLVMKQLTAWGSIVFGATLIAGIYGMNFQHMPELGWFWGYPFALGSMAVMSFVLYRIFKRRDWL